MMRITDLHCDMSEVVRVYTHEELTQLAALISDAAGHNIPSTQSTPTLVESIHTFASP